MKKILGVLLVMTFVLSTAAFAADDDMIDKLDLSREQVKQLRTQRREHVKAQDKIRDQIRKQETALKKEIEKEEPDQKKIRARVKEINQLRSKSFESRVDNLQECKKLMTKEQFRKMNKLQLRDGTGLGSKYQHRTKAKDGAGKQSRRK